MRKQQAVWKLIADSLQQGVPVMLLYVLESKGSSPGRQGFFMAVNRDGEMEGSIGGGMMEHKFVELAKEKLNEQTDVIDIRQQIHDKSAAKNQSGMICSGEQTILLYKVKPEEAHAVQNIIESLQHDLNGLLQLSPQGLKFFEKEAERDYFFSNTSETDWLYEEKTGYKNHLYIVGGGHCSLALTRLMHTMDFYIHIYDDRAELNTLADNDCVHEKTLVNDYSELSNVIAPNKNHYVIIMTFGYRTDDLALRALIGKEFKYLGILGSKAKIKKMKGDYIASGVPEERLKQIYWPVGIQIKSQTPEEIAVSIAAQIIKVKNEHL